MTLVGGAATLNMSSVGYTYGFQALIDPISVFVGLCIAILLIHKYRSDNFVSITESISGDSGSILIVTTFASMFFYTLVTAAQIVAFTKLIGPIVDFPKWTLAVIATVAVASYTIKSGIKSVTKTDLAQLIAVLVLFVLPAIWIAAININVESSDGVTREFSKMPINTAIIFGFTVLLVPLMQDIKVRAQAAESVKKAKYGFLAGAFLYVLIVTTAIIVGRGIAQAGVNLPDGEHALTYAFNHHFGEFGIIFIVAVMAAILSTMDSLAFSAISTAQSCLEKFNYQKNQVLLTGFIIFTAAFIFSTIFQTVLSLILFALLMYVSILLPIVVGKWLRINSNILATIAVIFILFAFLNEFILLISIPKALLYPILHLALVLGTYTIIRIRRLVRVSRNKPL